MKIPLRLSQHFNYLEATKTSQPFDNSPSPEELEVLKKTAMKMEEVRLCLGARPILVTSWFRSEAVNKAVGGVPNSQHRLGEAVDFICPTYGDISKICTALLEAAAALEFDQLIHEPGWVHISFLTNPEDPRKTPRFQYIDLSQSSK